MIPTAILLGMFGGLIPRYRWWSVPMVGIIWSIMVAIEGDPTLSLWQIWGPVFIMGALNGAAGVLFTVAVANAANLAFRWIRGLRQTSA